MRNKTSAATKSVLKIKRRDDLYVSAFAPYGYLKEPDNKHHLITDENTCKVIQDIYTMYLNNNSLSTIADILNWQGVLSPANYRRKFKEEQLTSSKWTSSIIKKILIQPIYTGDMVQGKTKSYSYKVKKEYLKARYTESIQDKESKVKALHAEIKATKYGLDQRIEIEIRKFKGMTQLNKQLLDTLVSKIIVSDKENIKIVFNLEDIIQKYL